MTAQGIGASVKRREDFRFIKGIGKYTDDIDLPNQLYCYILRSSVAHARVGSLDTSSAKAAPGVVAVFTSKDIAESGAGGVPCGWLITSRDGTPMKEPKHPILAEGKVRHVGDPVAAVIAESLEQAKNAAELIKLDLYELPAAVDMKRALKGGPAVHDEAADNLCFDWELGDKAATDAAFARSA
ncbi:MAG: xanthine dehydrogenase family protein molybdopterin-binding subunit, partial [Rhodomicrobium sp.]